MNVILCITRVFVYFIHMKFIFIVSYISQFNYHSAHTVITSLRIFMHLWEIWKYRNASDVWKKYIKYSKYKVKYKNVYHFHTTYVHLFTEQIIASDYIPLEIIKFLSEYVFHTATSLTIIHKYRLKSVTLYINIHTYIEKRRLVHPIIFVLQHAS